MKIDNSQSGKFHFQEGYDEKESNGFFGDKSSPNRDNLFGSHLSASPTHYTQVKAKFKNGQLVLPYSKQEFMELQRKVDHVCDQVETSCRFLPKAVLPNGSKYIGEWGENKKREG
jgi:hypothetical protein